MNQLLSGAFLVAAAAVALFFYQYWRRTGDRLFAIFCVAFCLLAVERLVLAFAPPELEGRHLIFVVRLLAYVSILVGVIDKNRPRRPRS